MNYRVIVSPKARIELYNNAIWWAENRNVDQAARWLDGLKAATKSLAENPERHHFASENESILHRELRQMLYGLSNKPTHRAVFEIRGETVFVHTVRHLAQRDVMLEDLE